MTWFKWRYDLIIIFIFSKEILENFPNFWQKNLENIPKTSKMTQMKNAIKPKNDKTMHILKNEADGRKKALSRFSLFNSFWLLVSQNFVLEISWKFQKIFMRILPPS